MMGESVKKCVEKIVEDYRKELWDISSFLFHNPETGNQEYQAAALQCEFLRRNGFTVEEKAGGLDTAFIGTFSRGEGPCVAIFSEYDSLPGELGHACGHNLIAAAAMGAAAAAKKAMEELGIEGTLMLAGAPDEEFTGGKITLLKKGCFRNVKAAMAVHPTTAKSRVAGGNHAYLTYSCEYKGKSAHSESRPWEGISAQNAALLFFNALGYARQMIKDGVRIQAYVRDGMQHEGTISAYAELGCDISAPTIFLAEEAAVRVEQCFRCGAVGTGCELVLKKEEGFKNRIPNGVLGEIFRDCCKTYGEEMMEGMPDDSGGEDLGNVSHVIPAINPHLTVYPKRKLSLHTLEFKEHVLTPEGEAMCMLGAKAMAATALRLMQSPELLDEAAKELESRLLDLYGEDYQKYRE
ncbi:p-aminobenzoyl-glutamate hydrolase subunit B [Lachnospiraceae bacterium]|nr:p-aminobenzoyl-glutamate hydrolase subunit B [Lachnospiraceae bacterium]